jgi:hypothetical protein
MKIKVDKPMRILCIYCVTDKGEFLPIIGQRVYSDHHKLKHCKNRKPKA